MALSVGDNTDSAHVAATGCHSYDCGIEADEFGDFARGQIDSDCVIDFDSGIRIADSISQHVPSVRYSEIQPKLSPTAE